MLTIVRNGKEIMDLKKIYMEKQIKIMIKTENKVINKAGILEKINEINEKYYRENNTK